MTLMVVPVYTRKGQLKARKDCPILPNNRTEDVDEVKVINERTKEVLLHLFSEPYDDEHCEPYCEQCPLDPWEYQSLCDRIPCTCRAWKNVGTVMEDL